MTKYFRKANKTWSLIAAEWKLLSHLYSRSPHVAAQFNGHSNCSTGTIASVCSKLLQLVQVSVWVEIGLFYFSPIVSVWFSHLPRACFSLARMACNLEMLLDALLLVFANKLCDRNNQKGAIRLQGNLPTYSANKLDKQQVF